MKNNIYNFKNILELEGKAILKLLELDFEVVDIIIKKLLALKGKVVATGIGKSAIIAQKFVATLNSTGTSAIFLHAADAIHGDLGVLTKEDIVFCISKSGNTQEIKVLIPLIKHLGNEIVGIVCDKHSYLAQHSDYVIWTPIEREACPLNLAPTTSTTIHLAVCDALAMSLLIAKGFTTEDFAKYHPGGSLGRKLYLKISDILEKKEYPLVNENENMKNVIIEISSKRLGATAVANDENKIKGIITDGDLRRMIEKYPNFLNLKAKDIMTKNFKSININELAIKAFYLMEKHKITQLIVFDDNENYKGMIHLHDILQAGVF